MLTTFYCYFCEQRLFPSKSKRLQESQAQNLTSTEDGDDDKDYDEKKSGHFQNNILTAALPTKDKLRSRKEVNKFYLDHHFS